MAVSIAMEGVPGPTFYMTGSATAQNITAANLVDGAVRCIGGFLQVQGAALRLAWDGTVPTADAGYVLGDGDFVTLRSYKAMSTLKFINDTGSNGTLVITPEF